MEELTNEMILNCLRFIKEEGGNVSRYSFDGYITRNINVKESFNTMPGKLLEEGLIDIKKEGKETRILITNLGLVKISSGSL